MVILIHWKEMKENILLEEVTEEEGGGIFYQLIMVKAGMM